MFDGLEQISRAETVILRGNVVVENGKYTGELKDTVVDGVTYHGCAGVQGRFVPGKPYGSGYDLLKK